MGEPQHLPVSYPPDLVPLMMFLRARFNPDSELETTDFIARRRNHREAARQRLESVQSVVHSNFGVQV